MKCVYYYLRLTTEHTMTHKAQEHHNNNVVFIGLSNRA